ncbi:MAG: SIS domain-containing protein [Caldilineaceae bacterium]
MTSALTYFDRTIELLQEIRASQLANIDAAADLCADRIAQGGLIFSLAPAIRA